MYEIFDQIVNIDYGKRGIGQLYLAAKSRHRDSLCKLAADMILDIPENSVVFLSTGSVTRNWVSEDIGETDGPIGTAVLANAIRISRSAVPVILTEQSLIKSTEAVARAAGLCVVSPAQALKAKEMEHAGATAAASVLPFPTEDGAAALESKQLIEELNPKAVICIEKADRNEKGIYHNMKGFDYSENRARVDLLVNAARGLGIPTIGIGDGGNEIGMQCVSEAVKKHIPYGAICQCPCSGGITSSTLTDLLVPGAVSNWVCYAVCAALSLKLMNPGLLHTAEKEKRLLEAALNSGLVDGVTGECDSTVDGYSLETNCSIAGLLHSLALKNMKAMS